jgi:hypothetical protein
MDLSTDEKDAMDGTNDDEEDFPDPTDENEKDDKKPATEDEEVSRVRIEARTSCSQRSRLRALGSCRRLCWRVSSRSSGGSRIRATRTSRRAPTPTQ